MSPEDVLALARFARSARPQQKWAEQSSDVWVVLLDDIDVTDARTAVVALAKANQVIDSASIRAGVKAIRDARIDQFKARIPPPPDPDDVAGSLAWEREWTRAIADGQVPPEPQAAGVQPMPDLRQLLPSKAASPTGRRAVAHTNPALAVGCPWCGALPNQRCVTASGPVAWLHEARQGAAPPSRKVST